MYFYKRIEDGALCAGSRPPMDLEKFIELTKEEYEAALAEVEEGD